MHIRGSAPASITFSGSRDLGLVLLASPAPHPPPPSHLLQFTASAPSAQEVSGFLKRRLHLLGSLLWFKTRRGDLNSGANLCLLLLGRKKKSTFPWTKSRTRLIFFSLPLALPLSLIELCHSDQSLIGPPAPSGEKKMEVQQLKVAVSAAEKSFRGVICLGSVPSLPWQQRSRERQCFWLPPPVLHYRLCSLWED